MCTCDDTRRTGYNAELSKFFLVPLFSPRCRFFLAFKRGKKKDGKSEKIPPQKLLSDDDHNKQS